MFYRLHVRNRIRNLPSATEAIPVSHVLPVRPLPSATAAVRSSLLAWTASVVVTR